MLVSILHQNYIKRAKINYVDFSYTPLGPLIVENRFFGTPPGYPKGSTSFMDAPFWLATESFRAEKISLLQRSHDRNCLFAYLKSDDNNT